MLDIVQSFHFSIEMQEAKLLPLFSFIELIDNSSCENASKRLENFFYESLHLSRRYYCLESIYEGLETILKLNFNPYFFWITFNHFSLA